LARADIVVDALLGTGSSGAPRAPLADWIRALVERRASGARGEHVEAGTSSDGRASATRTEPRAAGTRVVALDLPSGFDADTAQAAERTVVADLTATFAAAKLGFASAGAERWTGRVVVVDIGVPRVLLAPRAASDAGASGPPR